MNIYIEYTDTNDIGAVIDAIKSMNVKIFDVEITRIRSADGLPPCAIYSVRLPKKLRHADLMAVIAAISGVQTVEEL
jgi:hypothetical protein